MKTIQVSCFIDSYYVDNIILHASEDSDIEFKDNVDDEDVEFIESLLPEKYQGRDVIIISLNPVHAVVHL